MLVHLHFPLRPSFPLIFAHSLFRLYNTPPAVPSPKVGSWTAIPPTPSQRSPDLAPLWVGGVSVFFVGFSMGFKRTVQNPLVVHVFFNYIPKNLTKPLVFKGFLIRPPPGSSPSCMDLDQIHCKTTMVLNVGLPLNLVGVGCYHCPILQTH